MVRKESLSVGLIMINYADKLVQIYGGDCIRYDFVLYALLDLEPMKRFECRSDM